MKMKREISLNKLQEDAEELYRGGFSCSESVVCAIRDNFELDIPREVIALASGFSAGMGGSGCACGALAGGVMASGIFFGRTEQGDPKVKKNLEVSNELHDYFREATGKRAVCCRVLTRGFDKAKGEHKEQCVHYTGIVARKVGEIIEREFQLTNIDEVARDI